MMKIIPNIKKALEEVVMVNKTGVAGSLSFLPLETIDKNEILATKDEYFRLLKSIYEVKLDSDVTVKLHQFGIYGDKAFTEEVVKEIVAEAKKYNNFVWIDMERTSTTDDTIRIFENISAEFDNVGICLQAYLRRSKTDMEYLLKRNIPMRLVKGFYKEHDYKSWSEVTEAYRELMKYLLRHSKKPCIATHDMSLIEEAKSIILSEKIPNAEIQFFNGVLDHYAPQLVKEGIKVRIYFAYGRLVPFLWKGIPTFDVFRELQRHFQIKKLI